MTCLAYKKSSVWTGNFLHAANAVELTVYQNCTLWSCFLSTGFRCLFCLTGLFFWRSFRLGHVPKCLSNNILGFLVWVFLQAGCPCHPDNSVRARKGFANRLPTHTEYVHEQHNSQTFAAWIVTSVRRLCSWVDMYVFWMSCQQENPKTWGQILVRVSRYLLWWIFSSNCWEQPRISMLTVALPLLGAGLANLNHGHFNCD